MKPLNKNVYKEMKYGKKELTIVSVVMIIVSLALFAGGIALIVVGAMDPDVVQIVWRVIVGAVMVILGGIMTGIGITMFAVTRSMINAEEGNVADGNRAIGTINVNKCEKCGTKLSDDAKFCKSCGAEVEVRECKHCGKPLAKDSQFCEECGKGVEEK